VTSDPGWQRPEDSAVRPATARLVDPEEDLGGAAHGGDFETTRIPAFGAPAPAPGPSTGYGLVGDPEPLPYVQPVPTPSVAPAAISPVGTESAATDRRGTQDLGLLLLRLTLGVVFIAHGLQKAFGWWGGSGLEGLRDTLAQAGYQHAGTLTYVAAGAQMAAGVLLVLGLFTPIAGAAALAFLVNSLLVMFESQRRAGGVFIFGSEGAEYLLTLTALAAAVILAGPGRYGFDGGRRWARRPFIGSFLALLLGAAGGVAAWLFLHGTNPFA
jgi:putative oxidoreductase